MEPAPETWVPWPAGVQIVGITYRQLDYWARTDLVRPSIADAKGGHPAR